MSGSGETALDDSFNVPGTGGGYFAEQPTSAPCASKSTTGDPAGTKAALRLKQPSRRRPRARATLYTQRPRFIAIDDRILILGTYAGQDQPHSAAHVKGF
jgi:hypothetical protein